MGPGGSLKRLLRSLETKIAKIMVKKREIRAFSKMKRFIFWVLVWGCGLGRSVIEWWSFIENVLELFVFLIKRMDVVARKWNKLFWLYLTLFLSI